MLKWEDGPGEEPVFPVLPERGTGADHRLRRYRHDVARRQPRHPGQHDAGRHRAGERLHDAALHPAQLPRRALPRDPPGAHRHRTPVRPASREPRGAGRARRAHPGSGRVPSALRACRLFLRGEAPDPVRRRFHDTVGAHGGGGRPLGFRQEHPFAPAVPLLRRAGRLRAHQRPRHPPTDAGQPARGDRHRAPGHGAVQRQHLLQHPVWPARSAARGSDRRGESRPTSTSSSSRCPTGTTPRSASAGSSSPAAKSSGWRSPARC